MTDARRAPSPVDREVGRVSVVPASDSAQRPRIPVGRFDWERVVRDYPMKLPVKLLALVLATYADPDGTRVHPGLVTIQRSLSISESTVKRQMKILRDELGLIERTKHGNRWAGHADEYRLTLPSGHLFMSELVDSLEPSGAESGGHSDDT